MTNKDERPPRPTTSEEKQARLKELEELSPRDVIIQIMNNIGDEERVSDELLLKVLIVLEELESFD